MENIIDFKRYVSLLESHLYVTSHWKVVSEESGISKDEGFGYLIFNQSGVFSIVYSKKNEKEESRIDFYVSKESSPDKKSLCKVCIIDRRGKETFKKNFYEIDEDTIWEIICLFFDYSDLERISKNERQKFLIGFTKSIKAVYNSEKNDQLPSSFKSFFNLISDWCKSKDKKIGDKEYPQDLEIVNIVNKFIKDFNLIS